MKKQGVRQPPPPGVCQCRKKNGLGGKKKIGSARERRQKQKSGGFLEKVGCNRKRNEPTSTQSGRKEVIGGRWLSHVSICSGHAKGIGVI